MTNNVKKWAIGSIFPILMMASVAQAAITPVGVTASSTLFTYNVNNLINDSGLNNGLHDGNYNNMWLDDNRTLGGDAVLTFDLGQNYQLGGSLVWQSNSDFDYTRNTKDFDILTSLDGINFIKAGSYTLTQSTGGNIPAQTQLFNAEARYVRFDILTNYGSDGFTGLSEVKFIAAVPEPETYAMLLAGLGLIGFAGKKRQR